jgi:type II secretory pathway pseudopilin PulG
MSSVRPRRDGFVLIEALAVLALGSILLGALAGVVTIVVRMADRTAAMVQQGEGEQRALDAIARELGAAVRLRWAGDDRGVFVFQGERDGILFAVDRRDETGLRRSVVVAYRQRIADGRVTLVRLEAPIMPGAMLREPLAFGPEVEICAGALSLRFEYASSDAGTLTPTWEDAGRLPDAVRAAFIDPASGGEVAFRRASLRVNAEPACALRRGTPCSRFGTIGAGRQGPAAAANAPGGRTDP